MKRLLITITVIVGIFTYSCGPSEAEIERKAAELQQLQAAREKAIADSVAQVYQEQLKEKEREMEEIQTEVTLRQSLYTLESNNPLDYLDINFDLGYQIIGGKDIIYGKFTNRATLAQYKDIELEIRCYSKTQSLIKTVYTTIYEYVPPQKNQRLCV